MLGIAEARLIFEGRMFNIQGFCDPVKMQILCLAGFILAIAKQGFAAPLGTICNNRYRIEK